MGGSFFKTLSVLHIWYVLQLIASFFEIEGLAGDNQGVAKMLENIDFDTVDLLHDISS
jgi:uncharacterized membrane protein YtjA (UPF0391 family)